MRVCVFFLFRMSPTEFSNYIKQRAMQQQIHHHHSSQTSPSGRALSPNMQGHYGASPDNYYYTANQGQYHPQPPFGHRNLFDNSQYMPEVYNNNNKFQIRIHSSEFFKFL